MTWAYADPAALAGASRPKVEKTSVNFARIFQIRPAVRTAPRLPNIASVTHFFLLG